MLKSSPINASRRDAWAATQRTTAVLLGPLARTAAAGARCLLASDCILVCCRWWERLSANFAKVQIALATAFMGPGYSRSSTCDLTIVQLLAVAVARDA